MVAVVINIDGVQAGLCIVTCLSFKESWLLSSLRGGAIGFILSDLLARQ